MNIRIKKRGHQVASGVPEVFPATGRTAKVSTPIREAIRLAKKHPIGTLRYTAHRKHELPGSLHICAHAGRWYVSFSTEDGREDIREAEVAAYLQTMPRASLEAEAIGLDRGVALPVAASTGQNYTFRPVGRKRLRRKEWAIRQWQRRFATRDRTSARRRKAQQRVAALARYAADLRRDFAHQTSRKLVNDPEAMLFVFEDLKIQNMTRTARGTTEQPGQKVRQKAGLNRAILDSAWGRTREYLHYKALRAYKLCITVPPFHSSQECRVCGHVSQDNRISQSEFVCQAWGHTENVDTNAAQVLAQRGVEAILSGSWKPKERKRSRSPRYGRKDRNGWREPPTLGESV